MLCAHNADAAAEPSLTFLLTPPHFLCSKPRPIGISQVDSESEWVVSPPTAAASFHSSSGTQSTLRVASSSYWRSENKLSHVPFRLSWAAFAHIQTSKPGVSFPPNDSVQSHLSSGERGGGVRGNWVGEGVDVAHALPVSSLW